MGRMKSMNNSTLPIVYSGCLHDFHEMMVYAMSCGLPTLMPINPIWVFVCQIAATSTLVTHYVYWDIIEDNVVQILILALLPRVVLSFSCTAFALHQHRYLSVIKSEKKRVVEESVRAEEERKRLIEERVKRFHAER